MSSPDPVAMPWLTVALEEYKALRAEIVEAIQAQRTICSWESLAYPYLSV